MNAQKMSSSHPYYELANWDGSLSSTSSLDHSQKQQDDTLTSALTSQSSSSRTPSREELEGVADRLASSMPPPSQQAPSPMASSRRPSRSTGYAAGHRHDSNRKQDGRRSSDVPSSDSTCADSEEERRNVANMLVPNTPSSDRHGYHWQVPLSVLSLSENDVGPSWDPGPPDKPPPVPVLLAQSLSSPTRQEPRAIQLPDVFSPFGPAGAAALVGSHSRSPRKKDQQQTGSSGSSQSPGHTPKAHANNTMPVEHSLAKRNASSPVQSSPKRAIGGSLLTPPPRTESSRSAIEQPVVESSTSQTPSSAVNFLADLTISLPGPDIFAFCREPSTPSSLFGRSLSEEADSAQDVPFPNTTSYRGSAYLNQGTPRSSDIGSNSDDLSGDRTSSIIARSDHTESLHEVHKPGLYASVMPSDIATEERSTSHEGSSEIHSISPLVSTLASNAEGWRKLSNSASPNRQLHPPSTMRPTAIPDVRESPSQTLKSPEKELVVIPETPQNSSPTSEAEGAREAHTTSQEHAHEHPVHHVYSDTGGSASLASFDASEKRGGYSLGETTLVSSNALKMSDSSSRQLTISRSPRLDKGKRRAALERFTSAASSIELPLSRGHRSPRAYEKPKMYMAYVLVPPLPAYRKREDYGAVHHHPFHPPHKRFHTNRPAAASSTQSQSVTRTPSRKRRLSNVVDSPTSSGRSASVPKKKQKTYEPVHEDYSVPVRYDSSDDGEILMDSLGSEAHDVLAPFCKYSSVDVDSRAIEDIDDRVGDSIVVHSLLRSILRHVAASVADEPVKSKGKTAARLIPQSTCSSPHGLIEDLNRSSVRDVRRHTIDVRRRNSLTESFSALPSATGPIVEEQADVAPTPTSDHQLTSQLSRLVAGPSGSQHIELSDAHRHLIDVMRGHDLFFAAHDTMVPPDVQMDFGGEISSQTQVLPTHEVTAVPAATKTFGEPGFQPMDPSLMDFGLNGNNSASFFASMGTIDPSLLAGPPATSTNDFCTPSPSPQPPSPNSPDILKTLPAIAATGGAGQTKRRRSILSEGGRKSRPRSQSATTKQTHASALALSSKRARKPSMKAVEAMKYSSSWSASTGHNIKTVGGADQSEGDEDEDEDEDDYSRYDADEDRPQILKNSRSMSKGKSRERSVGSIANIQSSKSLALVQVYCHQCRNKNTYDKMRCTAFLKDGSRCGLRFCEKCIVIRYPDLTFDGFAGTFTCPKCSGYCNCTSCCAKRGETYVSTRHVRVERLEGPRSKRPKKTRSVRVHARSATPDELPYAPSVALPQGAIWGTVYGVSGRERMGIGVVADEVSHQIVLTADPQQSPLTPQTVQPKRRAFIGKPRPRLRPALIGSQEEELAMGRAYIGDPKCLNNKMYLPFARVVCFEGPLTPASSEGEEEHETAAESPSRGLVHDLPFIMAEFLSGTANADEQG